jgi:hypothetical protein
VKNRFQNLPFKCNLQRYNVDQRKLELSQAFWGGYGGALQVESS